MDWNRAKNIIIALLFALNLFLLGNYLYTRYTQADSAQTQAELGTYLASRGVNLSCTLPQKAQIGRRLMIAENTDKQAQRALPLILGEDAHEENGETVSSIGRLSWVGGMLEGSLTPAPEEGDELEAILARLASAGITTQQVQRSAAAAVLIGQYGDPAEPVYNMRLSIELGEDGAWLLSGRWYLGAPTAAGEDSERDIAGLLVSFTDRLLTQGAALGEISAIEQGWVMSTLTNVGTQLTPAFRITTDAGIYFISALDGQALDLN